MALVGLSTAVLAATIALIITSIPAALARHKYHDRLIFDHNIPKIRMNRNALDSRHIPFASRSTTEPFGSYLQQTLNYSNIQPLFDIVNTHSNNTLKSRGEAHVTVVTPPEFAYVLEPVGITLKEIENIATKRKIQSTRLKPVCLGRFEGPLPGPGKEAGNFLLYSLVVADVNNELASIRREIYRLFRKKGGEGALFQPNAFWPHVTLGYSRRDLFIEDGIYKGSNFCYAPIHLVD